MIRAALGFGLTALGLLAGAAAGAPPRIVPWTDAAAAVGDVVAVEGRVRAARLVGETCVLEFGEDPRAFRAVLLLPLLSAVPPDVERRWVGRAVRVAGRVQRFRGRPEMVLRSPDQIEVVSGEAAPVAAAPVAPLVPTLPPAPAPAPPLVAQAAPCERARARWRAAAALAREHAAALARCVEAMDYRCREVSRALAPALGALDAREADVEARCP